ncbi:hypothetical protein DFS33DRAFT_526855 [Desarmillaria ectypa]|nr:hypothetical protein DFS33DRAFT_526855 [Desarmillaria ectypa]
MPMMTTIRHFPILQLLYRLPELLKRRLSHRTTGHTRFTPSKQTAAIKESSRISNGVLTTVRIGSTFVFMNEDIFPDPRCFDLDRWLQPGTSIDCRRVPDFVLKGPSGLSWYQSGMTETVYPLCEHTS